MGWIRVAAPVDDPAFGKRLPCECQREQIEARRERIAKVPPGRTFENWQERRGAEEALAEARRFAAGEIDYNILVLKGGLGRGKTHLVAATCHAFFQRGQFARYRFAPDLRGELMGAMNSDTNESTNDLVTSYEQKGVLGLDDLGAGRPPSDFDVEYIERIVNARYDSGPPLFVTTNLGPEAIARAWGGRISARLFDAGSGRSRQVYMTGPDHRERKGT